MSDISQNRVGADGVASTPTTYHVGHLKLIANNKSHEGAGDQYTYDITNQLAYFEINESIESPGLEVILAIGDSSNFLETIRLQGSEKLKLNVYRKQPKGTKASEKKSFTLNLRIAEIFNYVRAKPGFITYSIRAVTEHIYLNNTKSLTSSFKGSPSDLIKTISTNILNIENGEYGTGSKNIIDGIYPTVRPLNAITWLLGHAFDQSTPYFYYQTLAGDGKVHLKSYKKILSEDVFETSFELRQFANTNIALETREGYQYERESIRDMKSEYSQSKFMGLRNGAYGSTLHTVDIANKEYKKTVYQYSDSILKLNQNKPFSETERAKIANEPINNLVNSKNYFVSLNSKAFDKSNNYNSTTPIDLQKSMGYLENLNYQTHRIQVAGDFDLSVGQKVRIKIRRSRDTDGDSGIDKLQSGIYLITAINHSFKNGFYQFLTIQKDSSEVSLDDSR